MPVPAKLVTIYGLLADVEASYGGGATLSPATDGIQLADEAVAALAYLFEGERNPGSKAGGTLARVAPSGRYCNLPVSVEIRGAGQAYAAGVKPETDVLLRLSGHSATGSFTGGSEKWTYAPIRTNIESGAVEAYARGEVLNIDAVYSTFGFEVAGPGFGTFAFELQGIAEVITEAALPSITLSSVVPPVAENITLDLNGFTTAVVRSISFANNREISPRANINSAGHAGYALGSRGAVSTVVIEQAAFSDLNPYSLRDAATVLSAFSWQIGSTQYNRMKFNAPQSQIVNVEPGADGPVGLWTLTIEHHMSAPNADDEYSVVFD